MAGVMREALELCEERGIKILGGHPIGVESSSLAGGLPTPEGVDVAFGVVVTLNVHVDDRREVLLLSTVPIREFL